MPSPQFWTTQTLAWISGGMIAAPVKPKKDAQAGLVSNCAPHQVVCLCLGSRALCRQRPWLRHLTRRSQVLAKRHDTLKPGLCWQEKSEKPKNSKVPSKSGPKPPAVASRPHAWKQAPNLSMSGRHNGTAGGRRGQRASGASFEGK